MKSLARDGEREFGGDATRVVMTYEPRPRH
jgi:hypothetical protein